MATTKRKVTQTTRAKRSLLAVACRTMELTTTVTEIRRAARTREAAIDAVIAEVWVQVNARRVVANQECGGECADATETCMQTLKDDVESRITVRRTIFMAPPPPPAPAGGVPVATAGYRATLPTARVRSRCECALIV